MERHLGGREFFVADRPTVADLALYAYTHVAHEGGFEMGRFVAIDAWSERIRALSGYVPITA
jgi:glutathione S-transferase